MPSSTAPQSTCVMPRFQPGTVSIAPSILSADFAHLGAALHTLTDCGADWIHVDVMDGHFVPNLTLGPPIIGSLRKETPLPFDVHLMIERPELSIADYARAGAQIITVHAEACTHLHRTLNQIRELGCKAGVSLNPATSPSVLEDVLDEVDLILVMSVNPGFGGQKFIARSVERLRQIKGMIADRPIWLEIDGGISPTNAGLVIDAGANAIVAGSAVFNAADMAQIITALRAGLDRPTLQESPPNQEHSPWELSAAASAGLGGC